MKTVKTLTINGQEYVVQDPSAVSVDPMQLDEEKQKQARSNIGAVGVSEVDSAVAKLINDNSVSPKSVWSSKNIIDKLCPAFTESGAIVTCEPVEGYPLDVVCWQKNLIGVEADDLISGKWSDDTGNIIVNEIAYCAIPEKTIEPNTTYTLSTNLPLWSIWFANSVSGRTEALNAIFGGNSATFTTPFDCDCIRITVVSPTTVSDDFEYMQLEKGNRATEYEPYKPATIVTRCGKNLADPNRAVLRDGKTKMPVVDNGVVWKAGNTYFFYIMFEQPLPAGTKVTATWKSQADSLGNGVLYWTLLKADSGTMTSGVGNGQLVTATAPAYGLYLAKVNGSTPLADDITISNIMVSLDGDVYEPFKVSESFAIGETVPATEGVNTIWADSGEITVSGKADPTAINNHLQKRLAALEAAIVNNT